MYAVERLGSYITRGVYTVSGPFHPFGGAVDIIVVQQQDGSFKSSPWYVRFGKFQGVLKSKEKIVNISVNGVEAGFHMFLDHKGEAYFLKESDVGEGELGMSPPSSGDETDMGLKNGSFKKIQSCNFDGNQRALVAQIDMSNGKILTRTNSKRARILGLMFGRRSTREDGKGGDVQRVSSLERAEIAADLLEVKWSTNLKTNERRRDNSLETVVGRKELVAAVVDKGGSPGMPSSQDGLRADEMVNSPGLGIGDNSEAADVCREHFEETATHSLPFPISDEDVTEIYTSETRELSDKDELIGNPAISSGVEREPVLEAPTPNNPSSSIFDYGSGLNMDDISSKLSSHIAQAMEDRSGSDLGISSVDGSSAIQIPRADCPSYGSELQCSFIDSCNSGDQIQAKGLGSATSMDKSCILSSDILTQEFPTFRPMETVLARGSSSESLEDDLFLLDIFDRNHKNALQGSEVSGSHSKPIDIPRAKTCLIETNILTKSLPNMRSHIHELEQSDPIYLSSCPPNENSEKHNPDVLNKECISSSNSEAGSDSNTGEVQLRFEATTIVGHAESREVQKGTPINCVEMRPCKHLQNEAIAGHAECQVSDAEKEQVSHSQHMIAVDETGKNLEGDAPGGSWRIWPFIPKKSSSFNTVLSAPEGGFGKDAFSTSESIKDLNNIDADLQKSKTMKKSDRSLTPTSEELASLNLQEGRNVVTFNFSTAMLGRQQVDARIYLWKWNTRIVVSDVDGTITRSDVLGQFMPLMGIDWSQTGVAHLFSAIKENGYQLLFLSARAISQAYLTRQFLFNLKQDGKALPDGPVIISPDGLVPSLYREVIRRAPHEFKISCLEDIRELFPPCNSNPFYAGFGNRDTDEISYRKVGIPKGKIFIINPKGEVAVNRRVDTKSYPSLHSLVNGMFPVMPSAEQEDYNSWNFWKLPILDVDLKH